MDNPTLKNQIIDASIYILGTGIKLSLWCILRTQNIIFRQPVVLEDD